MSKTFYRPTITLQKTIGDQLYEMLQGPVFEYIRNECEGEENDESIREEQEVSAMLISERVFPNLFRLCQQAKEALNFEEDIDFYITSHPYVNAWSLSSNAPSKHPHIIELYSGLVNLMSEKELLFIIGHEIGHIINGDSQLRKLRQFIYGQQQPEPLITYRFDIYNLLCELGADRYGYIAYDGDEEASIRAMYKLVSGFQLENVRSNVQALIEENQKHLDYFMHNRDKHHFGHEVGWDDKKIAKMIEASFRDYYNPNVLHYSEETQIQDL